MNQSMKSIVIDDTYLIDVGVRFHVRVEHGFVDARVTAFGAFKRFRIEMIARVVLEVVFVFGHERTVRASQQFFGFDVRPGVFPKIQFGHGNESALRMFTLVRFQFALRRHPGNASVAHLSIVHSYTLIQSKLGLEFNLID